jgi:hypothetical protein
MNFLKLILIFLSFLIADSAFALGLLDNVSVATAFKSGAGSAAVVVTGVIGVGGTMTALGLVYSWLKR